MYSVAIFEDEIIIRKSLINQIDWKSLGCFIVAECSNGLEGIDIIDNMRPDILITDIRLYGCEAIEVCKHIKSKGYSTKIIMMTGYAKMDYAQAAIKHGVSDFILKPIDPDEMIEAVKKCVAELKEKESADYEYMELKKLEKKEMPKLVEMFFYELYSNRISDSDYIRQRCQFLHIELSSYACIAMDIDVDNNVTERVLNDMDSYLLGIKEVIEKIPFNGEAYWFIISGNIYIVVNDVHESLNNYIEAIQESVCKKFNLSVSAGISNAYNDVVHISQSMKEAEHALRFKFHLKKGSLIRYQEVDLLSEKDLTPKEYSMDQYISIANNVIAGNAIEAKRAFNDLWKDLSKAKNQAILRNRSVELLIILAYQLKERDFDLEAMISLQLMYEKISKLTDSHSIYMLINNLIYLVAQKRSQEVEDEGNDVIECIKSYIDENYSKSISLKDLADVVFLSEKYVSTLVKKETGKTVTDLITLKRIEVAKELLSDFTMKTYEVANRVGINDGRYFSQMFRKHTGFTPTKYRQRMK